MIGCGVPVPSHRAIHVQLPIIPQVADWIRMHPGTISLGQGVAGYPPPAEAWAELDRLRHEPALHRYQGVDGLPELRDALTERLQRRHGLIIDASRALMVTAGANAAFLQVVLAICDPGDEVVLPLPYYFNQEMALALANVRAVPVPSDSGHHPDLEAIIGALTPRTRAIVTVSPNNPTGAVYPEGTLKALNELCARRGMFHISDETYAPFVYDGARHVSPGAFDGASPHTISLFSFSKTYGFASWRIGCAVFPGSLRESLRKIQDTNVICPPVISQLAALGCLRAGDDWVAQRVAEVAAVRSGVLRDLAATEDLIEVSPADGAFYVLLRLKRNLDPLPLTHRLIAEHGVAVIPGSAFGLTEGCPLRVAYGALTTATASEGIGRLASGLRTITG